jgi:transcriptional regulator with XRE-family HTH domain
MGEHTEDFEMTLPIAPSERQPKGDHNRRLSLGLEPEQFAAAAGVTVEALREYERTGPDHDFDLVVAQRVGEALERLEQLLPNSEAPGVNPALRGRSPGAVIMDDAAEQPLRELAYSLWEADGRPDGRDQEYWYRATETMRAPTTDTETTSATDAEATERAFEASRKIGLQREFRKSPDDNVSGGFNQRRRDEQPAKPEPMESGTGRQMDDNIDDLGRRPDGSVQEQPGVSKRTSVAN